MLKFLLFFIIIFTSCSQSFIEETQNILSIEPDVSNNLDMGILLEWNTQWDFARVEILRGTNDSSLSVFKDRLVQDKLLDSETLPGQHYYYQVQAYNSKDRIIGQSLVLKGYRNYRSISEIVKPEKLFSELGLYNTQIEIYWQGNVLDVFRIYRASDADGSYKLLSEVTFDFSKELKFVDTNLKPGSTYFYKVASVGLDYDLNKVTEKYSDDSVEGSTKYAPTGLKASHHSMEALGSIVLTWDVDPVAEYYQLYRATEENGDYQLIVPFILSEVYIDRNLPNREGVGDGSTFEYPSYFYKIISIANGENSALSDPSEGKAINPKDMLDSPKSFVVNLDKSSYPYELNLSWDPVELPSSRTSMTYRLSKIDENNITNIIESNFNATSTNLPNESFNERWEYIVQAINTKANNRPGLVASKSYVSSTPAPPQLNLPSQGARIYSTNMTYYDKPVETHVYWHKWNGAVQTSKTGHTTQEWKITSTVGFIDLVWAKGNQNEDVAYYSIYRRKKEDTEWTKIQDNKTEENYKDTTLPYYTGIMVDGMVNYPKYEYSITASYNGQESAMSEIKDGFAIDSADILDAPSYLTVPFHWADGTGFKTTIKTGENSPKGIDQVQGLNGGANAMYLTWDKVNKVSSYQVKHVPGTPIVDNDTGADTTPWYTHNSTETKQWFNNETSGVSMTHMYEFLDLFSYVPNVASFYVVPVNNKGVLGNERGIVFREPSEKPAHY